MSQVDAHHRLMNKSINKSISHINRVDVLENLRLQVLDGKHEVPHGPFGGRVLNENARWQCKVRKKLNDGIAPTSPDKNLIQSGFWHPMLESLFQYGMLYDG
ncbi:uncharacterized protein [Rutidosis leptorrhynchoides]|uniref:uncharacterized protein isoform X2 n=1 Tax=Rutidosis leptorrhynchoides TaxID=125765 RepID=UPI003A991ABD